MLNRETAKTIASEYRQLNKHQFSDGVVVIFNSEVAGWMNELRDPQHWIAGCVAVVAVTWLAEVVMSRMALEWVLA
ncbi:MAG: hypothetical protein U5M23_12990 [Marinagarivorans sp.]|nr:hypothetical protein [Marinagarivorans sp.]